MLIHTTIDGTAREVSVAPGQSLLSLLRDDLGVLGPKNACEQGECGSCSVLLDGELVTACLVPAVQADAATVQTVASLVTALSQGELAPLQDAFLAVGAVQCGYCTPGMLVAAADLLAREPHPSEERIREALSGNLCRCTGYQKIVDAVLLAAQAEAAA